MGTKTDTIETSLDVAAVTAMASLLEANLVLTGSLDTEQRIPLEVTLHELRHFVTYMRALDASYRQLEARHRDLAQAHANICAQQAQQSNQMALMKAKLKRYRALIQSNSSRGVVSKKR